MSIDKKFDFYVKYLKEYFKNNKNITIIGMNDDRGFNVHKNTLMNLKDILDSNNYDIELLDLCSLFFNKTRHIDYFLKHNVNMEEIRLMQEYGTTDELNNAAGFNIPFMSGISKTFNKMVLTKTPINGNRRDIRISDKIKEAELPLIVYASGLNDIMYELHMDPFNLKKSYMERSTNPKYDYGCEKVNSETIKRVIEGHERNFENILGLNRNAEIYVLSAYFYTEMKEEYEQKFKEAILMYNEELEKLCNKYGITYIDCRFLEKTNYYHLLDNYFSSVPPKMIAYEIVKSMYENIVNNKKNERIEVASFSYDNKGAKGVMEELQKDIDRQKMNALANAGYERRIALDKVVEHERELGIFEEVEKSAHR